MSASSSRQAVRNVPLVSAARIQRRVAELAAAIARDQPPSKPLVVVAVMKGALIFLADLIRRLPLPLEIELVSVRSYAGARRARLTVGGELRRLNLAGRHVLVLDCILDSGRTLSALRKRVAARRPASLRTCVLLRKAGASAAGADPDYVGLDIPDVFVVGYGLDYRDRWRHLPYVTTLARVSPPEEPQHD